MCVLSVSNYNLEITITTTSSRTKKSKNYSDNLVLQSKTNQLTCDRLAYFWCHFRWNLYRTEDP